MKAGKTILTIVAATVLLCSCAARLTQSGAGVQTVTDSQRDCCCEFITVIATGEHIHPFPDERAQSALNQARNAVADMGGNAMRIIEIDANREEVTVVVEALKCDFTRMSMDSSKTNPQLVAEPHGSGIVHFGEF